ncbi:MAG: hypothetical protein KY391_06475 [Actinobacteria bacterium]|nr:hypothetical protein [Actinomycetota bacterium]
MGGQAPADLLSLFHVRHEADVSFPAPPEFVWESLTRTDLFDEWWAWMRDVRLDGVALTEGSTISFTIDPPIPYRFRIAVNVMEADEGRFLLGEVTGDLVGDATFELNGDSHTSDVHVMWDVEIRSPLIRPVILIARPILLRAQVWAVDVALRGFRRYLAEQGFE